MYDIRNIIRTRAACPTHVHVDPAAAAVVLVLLQVRGQCTAVPVGQLEVDAHRGAGATLPTLHPDGLLI